MASFQKRGKTWQYKISRMVNGESKPIRKGGFRTKKEAQVAAAEIESKLNKGLTPHLTPVAFADYFEKWIKLYKSHLHTNTKRHYDFSLKEVEKHFKDKAIQKITRHDYQLFINEYGSTRAKETVEKLHIHCRACVLDAIEEGIIHNDFTRKAVITYKNQAKKDSEKHLNYEDTEKLTKTLYEKLDDGLGYYLLLLGLTSGLRFAELVGLTRKDFNFKENTLNVDKTWGYTNKHPKGFGPTKNEQSERIIKMDSKTMKVFEELFERMPTNIHQLVFYSETSKYKVISNTNANKLLRKTLKALKIDSITVHGLRHTHASVLLYKKASIHYVSERLGHADIETTLKDYTHVLKELREDDEKTAINVFEKMAI